VLTYDASECGYSGSLVAYWPNVITLKFTVIYWQLASKLL